MIGVLAVIVYGLVVIGIYAVRTLVRSAFMTATQAFTTAAARRRKDPLVLVLPDTPDVGQETKLRIDPQLDITQYGSLFKDFMVGAKALPMNEDGTAAVSDEEAMSYVEALELRAEHGRTALRACLMPADRDTFDTIRGDIDIQTIVEIVNWMSGELTGRHPSKPESSSGGSSETGKLSTAGAPAGVLMPPPSPSTAPSTATTSP